MTQREFCARLAIFSPSNEFRSAGKKLLYTDVPMSTPLAGGAGVIWCSTTPYGWCTHRAGDFHAYDLAEDLLVVFHDVDSPFLESEVSVFFALVGGTYEQVQENDPRVVGFFDAFRSFRTMRAA